MAASMIRAKKRNTIPTIKPVFVDRELVLPPVTGGVVTATAVDCMPPPAASLVKGLADSVVIVDDIDDRTDIGLLDGTRLRDEEVGVWAIGLPVEDVRTDITPMIDVWMIKVV